MKVFVAAFLLPLVIGCPEIEPSTCGENEIACDMKLDEDGCWLGDWCMYMGDPEDPCGPHFCPNVCFNDQKWCPGYPPVGSDCPVPNLCVPLDGRYYIHTNFMINWHGINLFLDRLYLILDTYIILLDQLIFIFYIYVDPLSGRYL